MPAGFVGDPLWQRLIAPGATVLVLPTGDRTAASWWQVESGMRFALAVPATPFSPPALAAQPVVQGLVNNDLRTLDGTRLAAARLRAFLLTDHVAAVLVTPEAGIGWDNVVARATAARPTLLGVTRLYRVGASLRPLMLRSYLRTSKRGGDVLKSWLAFDGRRAQVRVSYRPRHARSWRRLTLSPASADADGLAVAMGPRGQAAVAFVELRAGQVLLRVATRAGHWRVATLEQQSQAIFSPRVAVLRGGTVLVTWIDEADPMWILRAAVLVQGGMRWQSVTLDDATTVANVTLRVPGPRAVVAFSDAVASESRVLLATFAGRQWRQPVQLATSLWRVSHISLSAGSPPLLAWTLRPPGAPRVLQDQRLSYSAHSHRTT